jgi:hypothetical protein
VSSDREVVRKPENRSFYRYFPSRRADSNR